MLLPVWFGMSACSLFESDDSTSDTTTQGVVPLTSIRLSAEEARGIRECSPSGASTIVARATYGSFVAVAEVGCFADLYFSGFTVDAEDGGTRAFAIDLFLFTSAEREAQKATIDAFLATGISEGLAGKRKCTATPSLYVQVNAACEGAK